MSGHLLQLDGLRKTFGRTVAVDHLDMMIEAGEFVTFLGPSGCGKTTTLRMLGGFEAPDEGRILLNGEDVTHLPPERRNVNMVFQDYALFPHLTVRRNIAFGLELRRMAAGDIDARVRELAEFLELGSLLERFPDQLSGGQRQRVALARALAPDPALLLLDEPLAALDAKLRGQVQQELKSIQRRTGKTFFFVTHDQDEAMTMSDRIVVMNAGRVEQDGTPEELYDRPASRFVAGFIGVTNLIEGRLKSVEGDRAVFDWDGLTLVARPGHKLHTPGEMVSASLRPEHVEIRTTDTDNDGSPDENRFEGRLVDPVFKGSRTVARVELAPDRQLLVHIDRRSILPVDGTPVRATFSSRHLSLI